MLKNYFQIAFRSIFKQKGYSFINISGLAIGLACCILIMLWIQNELSYDNYNIHKDRIYRIERSFLRQDGSIGNTFCSLAPSFVPLLKQEFPEIEYIARFVQNMSVVNVDEKTFTEEKFFLAESDIFEILTIPFISGNPKTALNDPNTIVISESISKKYFGNENPLGKRIKVDDSQFYEITGVFRDMPLNSHVHFDFLGSMITLKGKFITDGEDYFYGTRNFSDNVTSVYLRLAEGIDPDALSGRIPGFLDRHLGTRTDDKGNIFKASQFNRLDFRKISDIHLNANTRNELEINGDTKYISFFSIIAVFILIIACVNYINLATARASRRAREVGLRKVVGAGRTPLVIQFLVESIIISLIALLLGILISIIILPYISAFAGSGIKISAIFHSMNIAVILGIFLFTVLLSGLYPALYIAGFKPSTILRGAITHGKKGMRLRKTLVVIQFAISIILIINVGITFMQMNFLQNADLGFDKENIILIPANDKVLQNWNTFKQNLINKNEIVSATLSKRAPAGRLLDAPGFTILINGEKRTNPFSMPHNRVEFDFFKTYGMKIIAGRNFSDSITTDERESFIINETAVKNLGLKNPGEAIGLPILECNGRNGSIIGVVADFNYESLRQKIVPIITYIAPEQANTISIRIKPGNPQKTVEQIRNEWQKFLPGLPMEYEFLNSRLAALYKNEERMMQMFEYFSILAILIACLGLFGLASYTTEQRTKEIGVRKALGASIPGIVVMLSKQFTKWVFLSNIIAWPIAFYFMNKWLQSFAYRIDIGIWIFIFSAIISFFIACITVVYQSIKAANVNPVKSLKYE